MLDGARPDGATRGTRDPAPSRTDAPDTQLAMLAIIRRTPSQRHRHR